MLVLYKQILSRFFVCTVLFQMVIFSVQGDTLDSYSEFKGVDEANVTLINGTPILKINDEAVPPLIFFFNTETGSGQHYLEPQVRMAADAGVHIYSMPFDGWPWSFGGDIPGPESFQYMDAILDRFLEVNPKALFIPRIRSTPPHSWPGWDTFPESERIQFLQESSGYLSAASDIVWEAFKENITRFIQHYESSPYAKHFLGYHIGGQNTNEWFQWEYREKGPDYSEANQRRFQQWLRNHYVDVVALSEAWGQMVAFSDAEIPRADSARLPMWSVRGDTPLRAFYTLPEERAWVDYSQYYSDLIAERIADAAAVIKEVTEGRKLSVFFYGYILELSGSYSGHYANQRVLKDENVDILVAPLTYSDRLTGGAKGPMTAVDSVAAHGKLWLNEDDMRTYLIKEDDLPSWLTFEAFGTPTRDYFETQQLLLRNLGLARIHRHGTWWMDLIAAGAFREAQLWDNVMDEVGNTLFTELYEAPEPYLPEVAMIVDERSQTWLYNHYDVWVHTLHHLRDNLIKSGTSVGFYYLHDLLAGKVPESKVYVFANTYQLTEAEVDSLLTLLREQSATALWQYAPGYFTDTAPDISQMQRLTGLPLEQVDGALGIQGHGVFEGIDWGWQRNNLVSPRFVVANTDTDIHVLGHYRNSDYIAAARINHQGFESVFSGDIALSPEVLRAVFREAGVHLWVEDNSVVHCDGRLLVIHTADSGEKAVALPPGSTLYTLSGEKIQTEAAEHVLVPFKAGETRWFRLTGAE